MSSISNLRVRIFADGADFDGIVEMARHAHVRGFTTNPTLMRKAGVTSYAAFAKRVLAAVTDRPISFEVFSDDFDEMEDQALEIASWGPNVNVKIPVTNTRGEFAGAPLQRLSAQGVPLNVTALMTEAQTSRVLDSLGGSAPAYISVFAGRIADTGRDPMPVMSRCARLVEQRRGTELIWASPRELLNVFQADDAGVHIITVANDILKKLPIVGRDLDAYSLETVRMFRDDAVAAGFTIDRASADVS
jgi:transaldolase